MGNTGKYSAVSLFCGAGGLDMGFEEAGFHVVWANDMDRDACETHGKWGHGEVVCGRIGDVDVSTIPDSDIILGGFPCQGFSLSGPRRVDDSRNSLYRHYVAVVREHQPLAFIGENVKGLLTMADGEIFRAIREEFAGCGYDVYTQLVNARDFGVPQYRERVIIAGFRRDLCVEGFKIPLPDIAPVSLREAIGDMPDPLPGDVCHAPYSSRYMSRNRKRGWDEASFTIPAMAKQVALHPSSPDMEKVGKDLWRFGEGNTRRLSWREAAAIQTFPEGMEFCGDLTSKYRQIGNAVPVRLAAYVAREVCRVLDERKGIMPGK